MSRTQWNLFLAALLLGNLLRWGGGFGPVYAHPVPEEPPPGVPDTVITASDEEWEAMEVAGTNPDDPSFVVVPCKHIAPAGGPVQLDKVGCSFAKLGGFGGGGEGKPGGGEGEGEGKGPKGVGGIAMTSTLVVTKWRVKGHMHRVRGRP